MMRILTLVLLSVALTACEREPLPPEDIVAEVPYEPPAPVQLTPPPSVKREPGDPTVKPRMDRNDVQLPTAGHAYRPLIVSHDEEARREISITIDNNGETAVVAESGFHILPTSAAQEDGRIMICWNTLTGEKSEYSGMMPDPARGMSAYCRQLKDGVLGQTHLIRSPTVGCWIKQVIAMPDGRFRLIYKGDDGWFSAEQKPLHGTYSVFFENGAWTTPELKVPVRGLVW